VGGTGAAGYPLGTLFSGVPVSAVEFGIGAFVPGDGSATGQVSVTLIATTLLGQPIEMEFDGDATAGVLNGDGSATIFFNGDLSLGNGLPPLISVPCTVTVSASTVSLAINGISLPVATLDLGKITIQ
jgi:hypothetical protein